LALPPQAESVAKARVDTRVDKRMVLNKFFSMTNRLVTLVKVASIL
jgi:hypothetical protein